MGNYILSYLFVHYPNPQILKDFASVKAYAEKIVFR